MIRVHVDFTNAFNSMNPAAIWRLMEKFGFPDVDFIRATYEGIKIRIAPDDEENADVTFDTGVAQGSVLSRGTV